VASFEQRESGYWQAKVRRKGYPPQSKSFKAKAHAQAWARQIESEMDSGAFVSRSEAEGTTLKDFADRFSADFAKHHYRGQGWRYKLDRLVERLGSYSLAALTPVVVTWYRDTRLQDKDPRYKDKARAPFVSGATVKTELDLLAKVLDVAEKEFHIPLVIRNPVHSVRKPSDSLARDRRLSKTEWTKLEDECGRSRNAWLAPALRVSVETAMRQGELLSIRWDQMDSERQVIRLKKAETKTNSARNVLLSSRAVAVLESLPRNISGKIFALEKQTLHSAFKAAVQRAGIENFRWHDVRHEALSRLAESGNFTQLEMAAVSGHKTLQMLQRYSHFESSDLVKKLG